MKDMLKNLKQIHPFSRESSAKCLPFEKSVKLKPFSESINTKQRMEEHFTEEKNVNGIGLFNLPSRLDAVNEADNSNASPNQFITEQISDDEEENLNVCSICLESTEDGNAKFIAECGHKFHYRCIVTNIRHGHNSCPLCRIVWKDVPSPPHEGSNSKASISRTLFTTRGRLNLRGNWGNNSNSEHGAFGDRSTGTYLETKSRIETDNRTQVDGVSDSTYQIENPKTLFDHTIVNGAFLNVHKEKSVKDSIFDDDEQVTFDAVHSTNRVFDSLSLTAFGETTPHETNSLSVLLQVKGDEVNIHQTNHDGARPVSSSKCACTCGEFSSTSINLHTPCGFERLSHVSVDLVFVIDASKSKWEHKIEKICSLMKVVSELLSPHDRISIVAYSSVAWRIIPLIRMTEDGRKKVIQVLSNVVLSGGSNVIDGLMKAFKVLSERTYRNPIANIILISEGHTPSSTNKEGDHTTSKINHLNEYKRLLHGNNVKKGEKGKNLFPIYAFGFGKRHDSKALCWLSQQTGGVYSFIEDERFLNDVLTLSVSEMLHTSTNDTKISFSVPPGVRVKKILCGSFQYHLKSDGSEGAIRLGDMRVNEVRNILLKLDIPSEIQTQVILQARCSYRNGILLDRSQRTSICKFQFQKFNTSSLVGPSIDNRINFECNRQQACETIIEACRMADVGFFQEAKLLMKSMTEFMTSRSNMNERDHSTLLLHFSEIYIRMESKQVYDKLGRHYALAFQNSHQRQRGTSLAYQTSIPKATNSLNFQRGKSQVTEGPQTNSHSLSCSSTTPSPSLN